MEYMKVWRPIAIYTPKPEATPASKGARRSNRNRSPMSQPVESANARRVTRSSWKRLNKDKNESITQPQRDGKRLESESSSDVGGSSRKSRSVGGSSRNSRSWSDSSTISSTTKDSADTSSSQDNSKSPRLTGTPSRKRQCTPQPPPHPMVLAPACEKICTDSDHFQIPMLPSGKLVLPDGTVLKTGECIYAPWPTFTGFEALKETTRASGAEKGKSPARGRTGNHSSSKNKRKKQG